MTAAARKSIGAQRNPESKKAILRATAELLAERGVGGFSIEAVARRAQAGKPTIYRWWPDKTRLLLAVYNDLKLQLVYPDTGSLEGDVAGFLNNLLAFWAKDEAGNIFRSILAQSQQDEAARAALAQFHAERRAFLATIFSRGYNGKPGLDSPSAARLAELAVAYCFAQLLLGRLDTADDELRQVATLLVGGAAS